MVLAVTALIFKLKISQQTIRIDYPFMIIVTVLFGLILYYFKQINYIVGLFFIFSISFFSYFLISKSKNDDGFIVIIKNILKLFLNKAILNVDYLWMMLIFILLGIFIYCSKNQQISRYQGGILLLCYVYYIFSSIV